MKGHLVLIDEEAEDKENTITTSEIKSRLDSKKFSADKKSDFSDD